MQKAKIRLCVDQPLGAGQSVALTEAQAHYLFGVMRLSLGAAALLFNGRDGEWQATVESIGKRGGTLRAERLTAPQGHPADVWLLFAPVKKTRTDFIVEKAVELGMAQLNPVQTDFTNAERIRADKVEAHVREAAEQCGATWLAAVAPLASLAQVLQSWNPARRILWADEGLSVAPAAPLDTLTALAPGPAALLTGPEGGFSPAERARLSTLPFVTPIALGPRILRAETAALSLMTLWQAAKGDWR